MISRIYVSSPYDNRGKLFLNSWAHLDLTGKIKSVDILDCYTIDGELTLEQLKRSAAALTNPALEKFSVNKLPAKKFSYVLEVGFKPGVTDNVGHTARETVVDSLSIATDAINIYSSKVFLVTGRLKDGDLKKISLSLHNPLIERAHISKNKDLPLEVPEVILDKQTPVLSVSLNLSDEDLIRIGKEGIRDENANRRGPLALDLPQMKTIKKYFDSLGRQPTDIELESVAQTWSEHCKHTIFASPIDEIKE